MTSLIFAEPRYNPEMPSSEFLERFRGIDIPANATPEKRRREINFFIEAFQLVERTGWYDHTADWDLTISLTLTDGTLIDFGPGATVRWETAPDDLPISISDTRNVIFNSYIECDSDEDYDAADHIIDPLTIAKITYNRS